eukprot:1131846-Ditylum_brightwellii.AAC.1
MDSYGNPNGIGLHLTFKAAAQYIKARDMRNVDREIFYIEQGGYDMHREDLLSGNFGELNNCLKHFITEMKEQDLWDNIVIIMGSDFGRSITPNANGGTDHAWGGNYL